MQDNFVLFALKPEKYTRQEIMTLIHNRQDMNRTYLKIFPVPIHRTELELNIDSLIKFCYEMKRKNEKGVQISNMGGWQRDNIVNEANTALVKTPNHRGAIKCKALVFISQKMYLEATEELNITALSKNNIEISLKSL